MNFTPSSVQKPDAPRCCRRSGAVIVLFLAALFFHVIEGSAAGNPTPRPEARLWIGTATADITPDLPVVLSSLHVATAIESRCLANVLALESRQDGRVVDQAIMVSCDLCILPGVQDGLRKHLADRLPGFDIAKLFLAATHTHSAMMVSRSPYDEQDYGDAMQPEDYLPFLYQRMADAVVKAWENRAEGAVAWGLGHAVLGHGRRVVWADGRGEMCLGEPGPEFRYIEGSEDHTVDVLCFYDSNKTLKATAIIVCCPAQVVFLEDENVVSADFWHDVRELLHARYGRDLCVLGFCGPAGDVLPYIYHRNRKTSQERMDRLRGLNRTGELARRIVNAFDDVVGVMAADIRTDAPLAHQVRQIDLPARIVTDAEYAAAKKACDEIDAKPARGRPDWYWRGYWQLVVDRYEAQQVGDRRLFPIEMHVLRLGEVAIATNPFELFLDYGIQIQSRSKAEQTILIQLAAYPRVYTGYVPTPRALKTGGYGSQVQVNMIGPEGGQALVEHTVEAINGTSSTGTDP